MDEYFKYMAITGDVLSEISCERRLRKESIFTEIPTYGDVMSMENFIECCNDGGFIDYDGSGNYVRDSKMSDITVNARDITSNKYRKDFDSIVWFNK